MNVLLSSFAGNNMNEKLINAGTSAVAGSVIDCTSYTGSQTITRTISVTRSMTFVFGNVTLVANFTSGDINSHIFWVLANNVRIEGVSRTSNSTANGLTRFTMTNQARGYHVFVGNNTASGGSTWATYNNFSMANVDCQGISSVITNSGGSPTYSTTGSGGLFILSGNPSSATSTVSNVRLDNVWVSGARTHGIFLYNANNSKLTNCRVSTTPGHGIFLYKGRANSVDTCFATGCTLSGFNIKENSYTSLTSCASDSNGMGYILDESLNCTLTSCGAEANVIRATQPNNLGITMAAATPFTLQDIGAEAAFRYKGTSFWMYSGLNVQGCESNSLISCYSKDPSNVLTGLFTSEYTSHFGMTGNVRNCSIISPNTAGSATTKYIFRLDEATVDDGQVPGFCTINYRALTYDPLNPTESPNGSFAAIATVLDQGIANIFELAGSIKSYNNTSQTLVKTDAYANVNRERVTQTLVIPTYTSHPTVPGNHAGGMYFNTTLNKLYMWNNGWYDTCCSTVTAPACVWPSGFTYPNSIFATTRNDIKMIFRDNVGYMTSSSIQSGSPYSTFGIFDLSNDAFYNIQQSYGIDQYEWMFDIGENSANELCTYALGYVPNNNGNLGSYSEGTRIWMRNTVTGQVSFLDEPGTTEIPGFILTMGDLRVAANKLFVFFRRATADRALSYVKSYSLDDLSLIDYFDIESQWPISGKSPRCYASYRDRMVYDEVNENFILGGGSSYLNTFGQMSTLFTFNIQSGTLSEVPITASPSNLDRGYLTLHIANDILYIGCEELGDIFKKSITSGPYNHLGAISAFDDIGVTGIQYHDTGSEEYLYVTTYPNGFDNNNNGNTILQIYDLGSDSIVLTSQIVPLSAFFTRPMVAMTVDETNGVLWLNTQNAENETVAVGSLLKTCLPA